MVNVPRSFGPWLVLLAAALVLVVTAATRGAEYDEQYSLFLTGSAIRPSWPDAPFAAGAVLALQRQGADPVAIAHALRETDVHPPLYFWLLGGWRYLAGDGLVAARLLSVVAGLATLGLVGYAARLAARPPVLAMLLALGCYGFVYTSVIARGFAVAQMLVLAGAVLLFTARRAAGGLGAGLVLGAAVGANYLALFPAAGLLAGWAVFGRFRIALLAGCGMLPWLVLGLWFFLGQRGSRPTQFPPFAPVASLVRLGRFMVANVVGGLPLYVPEAAQMPLSIGLTVLVAGLAVACVRCLTPAAASLALASVAPAAGLLVLGAVFDNTPIELRYLAFAIPLAMPVLAGIAPRGRRLLGVLMAVQAIAIAGMIVRPETMQPAQRVAARVARDIGDGIALVPAGNDGVGIVGAFAQQVPPALRMVVIGGADSPADIRRRIAASGRVVLAEIAQDDASRRAVTAMRAAVAHPCWRQVTDIAFVRACAER